MLTEFRVENHRSVRDEQVLSMELERSGPPAGSPEPNTMALAPVAAIYGANASGKSNVLAALRFMRDAVVHSHRFWPPEGGVPREPFAWGPKGADPSLFEAAIVIAGVRYEYGFVVNDDRFLEEWLHAYPHNRKQVWFEREGDEFKFGEHLHGENRVAEKVTRPNGLFLAAAVQNRHDQLRPIFHWFRSLHTHNVPGSPGGPVFGVFEDPARWFATPRGQRSLFEDEDESEIGHRIDRFRELLRAADIGIVDIQVRTEDEDVQGIASAQAGRVRARRRSRVYLQHRSAVADAWLPLDEESKGTRQLFRLAPLVIEALFRGGVLIVDELESSFHPLLALQIVRAFNDREKNPRNAQLIFSTHDTNLLGTTLGEPSLARHQVWLTEKDDEGASRLYPLTDYKPRKAENLERGYLQGRYGAIPFIGDVAQVGKVDEE